jgi:hypothetical protein
VLFPRTPRPAAGDELRGARQAAIWARALDAVPASALCAALVNWLVSTLRVSGP